MELHFTCPSCQKRLKVKGSAMGSQIGCPACNTPLAVPRSGFFPGTRIAGFEIVRPLGKGGMGEVYLARQLSMGREIALKVLSAEFAAVPGAVERFVKEVHVAAKLEHAHIVAAYDAGQDEGLHYMAMSYVPGCSLAAMLKPGVVLAERDALAMTRKLAQALDYAWDTFRIIHRDIKPANILFDAKGEPKLADMGLSKSLDDAEAMTMSGSVMGTPNYMSPEQAEGAGDLDQRADIYSLGATLYHAVTGQMPFAGSSIMAVLRKQAVEILPDPREFNPQLSEHLVGLLQIMLAKNRDDRYADWKALIRDIDFVLDSRPPSVAVPAEGKSVLIRKGTGHGPQKKIVIPKEGIHPHPAPAAPPRPKPAMKPRDKALVFGGVVVLGLAVLATVLAVNHSKQKAEDRKLQAGRDAQQSAEMRDREAQAAKAREQAELWQVAADFAAANPDAFDRAIANFEDAGRRLAGTKYELMAKNETARIRDARTAAVAKALADLEARAMELADRKDFDAAAEVFAKYQGAFAVDLAQQRTSQEQKYRTLATEAAAKMTEAGRAAKDAERAAVAAVAEAVYSGDLAKAQQACRAFLDDPAIAIDKAEVKRIAGWLDQVAAADKTLLASFEAQKGETVQLVLDGARTDVRIAGVRGDRILIEQKKGVGWASAELTTAQMALEERHARLREKLDPAALGLWAGSQLLRARRPDLAAKQFQSAGPLAAFLMAKTEGAAADERESAAQAAWAKVLQAAGLPVTALQYGAIGERIQPGKVTVAQATAVLRQLDAYSAAFSDTRQAQSVAAPLASLRAALEAVDRGSDPPLAAVAVAARNPDAFARRVLAARSKTARLVRVAPQTSNGCLDVRSALATLKPDSQIRYTASPGDYSASTNDVHEFDEDGLILEAEPDVGFFRARITANHSVVRGIPRVRLMVASARDLLVTDCVVFSLEIGADSDVVLNNCVLINRVTICEKGRLEARNCTFIALNAVEPGISASGDLVLQDCVVVATGSALNTDGPRQIEVRNSLIFGEFSQATAVNSPWTPKPGTYYRLKSIADIPRAKVADCIETKPRMLIDKERRIYKLADGSPGRGVLPGGRDLGAETDANGLPVWPGRPGAVPARTHREATPSPAPPAPSPSSVPPGTLQPGIKPPVASVASPMSAQPRQGDVLRMDLGGGVTMDLIWIPPGEFLMGSPANELGRKPDEGPQHRVTISSGFWMGRYEVTQRQYEQLTGENPSESKDVGQDAPVENVDWNQAKSFCEKLQKHLPEHLRHKTVRLPTEAEWEHACRAGTTTALSNGKDLTSENGRCANLGEVAWYKENSGNKPHGIGREKPNAWGLHDMQGNVREWCWDGRREYTPEAQTDPEGPGPLRMARGGSWFSLAGYCRSATRRDYNADHRLNYLGFRAVLR